MQDVEISIAPGERREVCLIENAGAGYLWDPASLDPAVARVVSDTRPPRASEAESAPIGGTCLRVLVIEGVAPGQSSARHRRPWLGDDAGDATLTVNVG